MQLKSDNIFKIILVQRFSLKLTIVFGTWVFFYLNLTEEICKSGHLSLPSEVGYEKGHVGWNFEQSDLIKGVCAHSKGVGT